MATSAGTFTGRTEQLRVLARELKEARSTGRGRFVLLRGRRRVGKSRLAEEFLLRTKARHVFFAATRGRAPERELAAFTSLLAASDLPAAPLVRAGARFETWDAAFALIAESSERRSPSVVVIDEFPHLIDADSSVEGAFQTAWDRYLQRAPVLLVVIGSDLSMMAALTEYGRPLYDRPTRLIHLPPLTPAEIAGMLSLDPAGALDAYMAIGGFPLIAQSWGRAKDLRAFLRRELADPTAPIIVSGERMVGAEFHPDAQPRTVMSAIGAGERTFTAIGNASAVPRQSLERALGLLVTKRVVERTLPLSSRPSREARYTVADPYLRFWLRFIEPGLNEIERGRSDLVVERVVSAWPEYRGRAIEPLVREALSRLLPSARFGDAVHVGAYWTRSGDVEVDLVGSPRPSRPTRVSFVGSIKWRERAPFGSRDLGDLAGLRSKVPGADADTLLVGVSRSGFQSGGLAAQLGPEDLLAAWNTG